MTIEELTSRIDSLEHRLTVFERHDHNIAGGENLRTDLMKINDDDLVMNDTTTNDVSSSEHGFAPKSPVDDTYFLNGAATPAWARITKVIPTETLASDHTACGIIISKTAGQSLSFGDVVYFKADGKAWKADANDTGTYPAVGMAIANANAEAAVNILLKGIARDDTWEWTNGGILYLSTDVGAMTHTQPTATDNVIQVLGVCHPNADTIYFSPSINYLTHT